jgi:P-type Mg2+ transporter
MVQALNDAFWCVGVETLLNQVASRQAGLMQAEADERLLRIGPNIVVEHRRTRLLAKVAKRFAEPLVAILLIAAAISGVTGDLASFAIILVVVSLSIILDVDIDVDFTRLQ